MYLNEYDQIICFDTETRGLDFVKDGIIEIAWETFTPSGFNQFRLVDSVDVFVRQPQGIKVEEIYIDRPNIFGKRQSISDLTHITDAMLEADGLDESVVAEMVVDKFYKPKTLIMGYNLNFDLNMIKELLRRHGHDVDLNSVDYLDLMTVYKDYYMYNGKTGDDGRVLGQRLDAAVSRFEITVKNTHRAIDDVRATWEVFKEFLNRKHKILPYINVFGFNPKYEDDLVKVEGIKYFPQKKPKDVFYASIKDYKKNK